MLPILNRMAATIARRVGPAQGPPSEPERPDITPKDAAILAHVRPYTMTSKERVLAVIDAIRYLTQYRIPGAVVECGVWRGGSSMAAALALQSVGDTSRDMYLYDTFEGMTEPTGMDQSFDGMPAADQLNTDPVGTGVWCRAEFDEVRANVLGTGYPADKVHLVKGRVEETIPATMPAEIGLLRLDTDWYESTKHEFEHLYPRLVRGGVLIIDDYGHWQGSRKATDEYFAALPEPIFLQRVDYTGRIAVKV